jgi:hypothetical protein
MFPTKWKLGSKVLMRSEKKTVRSGLRVMGERRGVMSSFRLQVT